MRQRRQLVLVENGSPIAIFAPGTTIDEVTTLKQSPGEEGDSFARRVFERLERAAERVEPFVRLSWLMGPAAVSPDARRAIGERAALLGRGLVEHARLVCSPSPEAREEAFNLAD